MSRSHDLAAANAESARRYDWTPRDFGALDFDDVLAEKVRAFQRDRLLDETGFVDARTFKAFLQWQVAYDDGSKDREREANPPPVADVSVYPDNDPRVLATRVFRASNCVVSALDPAICDVLTGCGKRANVITSPRAWEGAARAFEGAPLVDVGAALSTRILDEGRASGAKGCAFAVFALSSADFDTNERAPTWAGDTVARIKALVGDVPVGVLTAICVRDARRVERRRAWARLAAFDAALPLVPGPYTGVETATGLASFEWAIYGQIRAPFQFPVYAGPANAPIEQQEQELFRLRDWLARWGFRGYGARVSSDRLVKALVGDVPREVVRIDVRREGAQD